MTLFSREFFDLLIIIVVIVGSLAAALRLYQDFTRTDDDDTKPNR